MACVKKHYSLESVKQETERLTETEKFDDYAKRPLEWRWEFCKECEAFHVIRITK